MDQLPDNDFQRLALALNQLLEATNQQNQTMANLQNQLNINT